MSEKAENSEKAESVEGAEKAVDFTQIFEEYTNRTNEVYEKHSAQTNDHYAAYSKAIEEARTARDEAELAARQKHEEVRSAAVEAKRIADAATEASRQAELEEISKNLLVADGLPEQTAKVFTWMISSGVWADYTNECGTFLSGMPFESVQAMKEFASGHSWCGEFDSLLRRAIREGAVEVDSLEWAEAELERELRRHLSYSSDRNEVRAAMDILMNLKISQARATDAEIEKLAEQVSA